MKMEKRTFRIGELTRALSQDGLEIEPSVIRFWEKEFNIRPKRSETGQRYYDEIDLSRFIQIRELLYLKRFTIEGARQLLNKTDSSSTLKMPQKSTRSPDHVAFLTQLNAVRTRLKKLRDLL